MHVGILTYQIGHLKTRQIASKLAVEGHQLSLFAFPFNPRPPRRSAFDERPHQIIDTNVKAFCDRHGIAYVEVGGWDDHHAPVLGAAGSADAPNVYLTCIGKIVPPAFLAERTILNVHPGLLPENRGVDAFKWAVVNGWPIGVTLHAIDEHIDRGVILHRLRMPVLAEDTLRDVADRAYDLECDLLSNFEEFLPNLKKNWRVTDDYPLSRKRIPQDLDRSLAELFARNRDHFIELSREPEPFS